MTPTDPFIRPIVEYKLVVAIINLISS